MRFRTGPIVVLAAVLSSSSASAVPWTAGESPDPQKILEEAQRDTAAGRHEDALAKFVWFHEHALETQPAMTGVRLSFALAYWAELGAAYPPALEKLRSERDRAGEDAREAADPRKPFGDFAAINRVLKEDAKTADLFAAYDRDTPERASGVYLAAEPALIRTKRYELCGKYIDADRAFDRFVRLREALAGMQMTPGFKEKSFSTNMATLVGLLAASGRKEDAARIAEKARALSDDAEYRKALDAALNGEVPPPWP
jgi:hypothetical protein